ARVSAAATLEDRLAASLPALATRTVAQRRAAVGVAGAALTVLGPGATLERGYAIVRRTADDAIVRDPAEAAPGTSLRIRVAKGELAATADVDPTP
ncbi:MAG TPA: exodeoxyribonuclease VII large subunit, partial [Candidatus Limnocylindrales bacterium]|nr:exodeoxyribonuclease VII large subunit [Candidatus Limnocylindrales bacterium]